MRSWSQNLCFKKNAVALACLLACVQAQPVFAKALTDGVSSSLYSAVGPGNMAFGGQQNLTPRVGLSAAYDRIDYNQTIYSGWRFGSNWLLAKFLATDWRANAILSFGLSGMQGPQHGHSGIWMRSDLDWENRHVLFAVSGEDARGSRMPRIATAEARAGYSPFPAKMDSIQPWIVASVVTRSGTGEPKYFSILRLLHENWFLELGVALNSQDKLLNLAVAL